MMTWKKEFNFCHLGHDMALILLKDKSPMKGTYEGIITSPWGFIEACSSNPST
jgi:hypothetical protein